MKQIKRILWSTSAIILILGMQSCSEFDKYEPLGANSIADKTPPVAKFSYAQGQGTGDEWMDYTFSNSSSSATTFSWDYGDGNTSTSFDGDNTYAGEGTYTVTLTVSDDLGVLSTFSETIEVIKPEAPAALIPTILEAGFDNGNDSRDPWRNGDLGGVIQITTSPVQAGTNAAKFPSDGTRIAYQELEISPNTDYILTYYYTTKTSPVGSITVSILAGGGHTDLATALAASLASHEGTDQTSSNDYVLVNLPFNTGANNTVSILVTNQSVESRIDSFSIALAQ